MYNWYCGEAFCLWAEGEVEFRKFVLLKIFVLYLLKNNVSITSKKMLEGAVVDLYYYH